MKNRYAQLRDLVNELKPKTIIEVGVHGALRGVDMIRTAREHNKKVRYIGYDVFETKSKQFQLEALNGKGIAPKALAEKRLDTLAAFTGGVDWKFVIGDTAQTLHGKFVEADFAFVDGDHRVAMIRGDAAALMCPVIAFDDYYTAGPQGVLTDIEKYGANKVVEEYALAGYDVKVLPKKDMTKEGCYSSIAVVRAVVPA